MADETLKVVRDGDYPFVNRGIWHQNYQLYSSITIY